MNNIIDYNVINKMDEYNIMNLYDYPLCVLIDYINKEINYIYFSNIKDFR